MKQNRELSNALTAAEMEVTKQESQVRILEGEDGEMKKVDEKMDADEKERQNALKVKEMQLQSEETKAKEAAAGMDKKHSHAEEIEKMKTKHMKQSRQCQDNLQKKR